MKPLKIALILSIAFFALLIVSPTATSETKRQPSARPLLSYTPEPYVTVTMYALAYSGTQRVDKEGNYILCDAQGDTYQDFGCTAFCDNQLENKPDPDYNRVCGKPPRAPVYPDPYGKNPIPMQTYYLLDVLSAEMSPGVVREPQALRAQAIASRSFAWNLIENRPNHTVRNSVFDQVYMPYKYDSLNREMYPPLEPNTPDPCAFYILRNASQ